MKSVAMKERRSQRLSTEAWREPLTSWIEDLVGEGGVVAGLEGTLAEDHIELMLAPAGDMESV